MRIGFLIIIIIIIINYKIDVTVASNERYQLNLSNKISLAGWLLIITQSMDHTRLMQASDIINVHLPPKQRGLYLSCLIKIQKQTYKHTNTNTQIHMHKYRLQIHIITAHLSPKHRDLVFTMYDEDDGLLTHVSSIENHRLLNWNWRSQVHSTPWDPSGSPSYQKLPLYTDY